MLIPYNNNLKEFARKNRKSGNLSEALLWNELKGKKLGFQFTRQKPILNFIVDFYCSKLNLAIEIDGFTHIDINKDISRQKLIEKLGVKFLRFQDSDIKTNLNSVIEEINFWIKNNS